MLKHIFYLILIPLSTGMMAQNPAAMLRINEIMSRNTEFTSEMGNSGDWVEIFNKSNSSITLKENSWSISDDPEDPGKFKLPELQLAPGAYYLIWCDDLNFYGREAHANFKLKRSGEFAGIYFKEEGNWVSIDELQFPALKKNHVYARFPDGSDNWMNLSKSTPGKSNLKQSKLLR